MASKIPGGGGKVVLNRRGMRSLLQSNAIGEMLRERMVPVQTAIPGSELKVSTGPTRKRARVIYGSDFEEAQTGRLSRALDLAGGQRGTQVKSRKAKRGE